MERHSEYALILIAALSLLAVVQLHSITGQVTGIFVTVIPGIQSQAPCMVEQNTTIVMENGLTALRGYVFCSFSPAAVNVTIPNRADVVFVNLSVTANQSRSIATVENGIIVSPAAASIGGIAYNATANVTTFRLSGAGAQEIFLYSNGTAKAFNATVLGSDLAVFGDYAALANATIITANRSGDFLSLRVSGTGASEVTVYLANLSEPTEIIIDNSTFTTDWTYDANAGVIYFSVSLSEHDIVLNYGPSLEPPAAYQTPAMPSSSSSGSGAIVIPQNFTSDNFVYAKLEQGASGTFFVGIRNVVNRTITVSAESGMRFLSLHGPVTLGPLVPGAIGADIYVPQGEPPGVYYGSIVLKAGSVRRTVDVALHVIEKQPLVSMSVNATDAMPGGPLPVSVDVQSRADAVRGRFYVTITDTKGNVLFESREEVLTVIKLLVERTVPAPAAPGEYVMIAYFVADDGAVFSSSDAFRVAGEAAPEPPQDNRFYSIAVTAMLIVLAVIILAVFERKALASIISKTRRSSAGSGSRRALENELKSLRSAYDRGMISREEYLRTRETLFEKIRKAKRSSSSENVGAGRGNQHNSQGNK